MKKIEDAMRQYCGDEGRAYLEGEAFIAGARYVLDAMTRDAAVDVFSTGYQRHADCIENSHSECMRAGLVAVREEIEGE